MSDNIIGASLPRALQYDLIAAHERGDHAAVAAQVRAHPEWSDAIVTFMLGLTALDGPEFAPTPALEAALDRAFARALATVGVAVESEPTLAEALRRAGLTHAQAARRLHLGVDVLDKLLKGRIAVATVPPRFFARLADLLSATADQAHHWLTAMTATPAPALRPALRRGKASVPADDAPAAPEAFADAVRRSPDMPAAARAEWLAD